MKVYWFGYALLAAMLVMISIGICFLMAQTVALGIAVAIALIPAVIVFRIAYKHYTNEALKFRDGPPPVAFGLLMGTFFSLSVQMTIGIVFGIAIAISRNSS